MIFTESNFNRIKNEESYKLNFNNYQTVEAFNSYVKNTLETENINILINTIIRIMNIINETDEDNAQLEIKELILKANLSKNNENFKDLLSCLEHSSDEKIIRINKIIDENLFHNLGEKINLLIEIEKLCEYFYPDFSDRLIMKKFIEKSQEKVFPKEKQKEELIDYANLDIEKLYKELTDEQKDSLMDCLSKDKNIWAKIKKYFRKYFP